MQSINDFLIRLDTYLGGAFYFPYLLLSVGLFFTLYLGFPQLRFFKAGWQTLFAKSHQNQSGDTSHFQALSTALSGTVGTGNIGGVGLAIFLGGPAALFWMWMTAFLGMTTKYVEVTLSHKYRVKTQDGTIAGGPMYYMDRKLNAKWLAIIFAFATICSAFGTGALPQINNIAMAMQTSFDVEPMLTGGVLACLLAFVIIGGITRIAKITSKIVPFMAVLYLVAGLVVIIYNYQNLVPSFLAVFKQAFTGSAAAGGFLGASFAYAFNRGVNRGLFSNEAGQGSSPIAHASAKTDEPVKEGMVAVLEPFIDTILLCTLTGMVILSSGVWQQKFLNEFDRSDMQFVQGIYQQTSTQDKAELGKWLNQQSGHQIELYSGELEINNGQLVDSAQVTLINARSIAENVRFEYIGGHLFNGNITIKDGKLAEQELVVKGESLLHSTALTAKAFSQSWFGQYGEYVVTIGILLFAFSTAISWSYYGDRAMVYLFGHGSVIYFRITYVVGFFIASFVDTTLIWNLATITVVLMTLPNLFALVLLRKDIKSTQQAYLHQLKHSNDREN
ncbi:AGCS family amino acid carrier protein [Catenovulum sp. 2E275]|uniref:alanine/glycine:cation symporter family protein n=1 Tax=Catenovulum sp. 2E275 TaxID=2980497 RepID=UPI0021D0567D|nr:AGCS family amino acid carrier protein [Catenovulum sp. 2E275]MCU4677163.1 AGCS family amino acid carrier protein [Catenovulum sp. 2E275]